MFERYTEKARRVIFFARYEACQFGSPEIETEHILLGILRETKSITQILGSNCMQSIRAQVEARGVSSKTSTSVDLPLSNASKRVLAYGAEEAERLNHRWIGTEHLFLGLLRETDCFAAQLLKPFGITIEQMRERLAKEGGPPPDLVRSSGSLRNAAAGHSVSLLAMAQSVVVSRLHDYNWHWQKTAWRPRDIVVHRKTHKTSLDTSLAADTENFEFVKGGWTKGRCAICRWEFFDSTESEEKAPGKQVEEKEQAGHSIGYTNGRDWICFNCHDKFWDRPEFISGSYSEIT